MSESKTLYSSIIKKIHHQANNKTTRITIPKEAIQLANLESDFYEIKAYRNRIEIRPHSFKFVSERKNTDVEKEILPKEVKPEPYKKPESSFESVHVYTKTFDKQCNNSDELSEVFDRINNE
jgi:hypothetical protein